jgi:single-strand DNA-binding protein
VAGSINEVTILGRLGADPVVNHTQGGKMVVNLNVATSDTWIDKGTNERKEATEWHRVVIFNENIGKIVEKYLKKGQRVHLRGQLKTRKWTDQGGVERYATEVVLQRFVDTLTLIEPSTGNRPPLNDGSGEDQSRPGVAPRGAAPRTPAGGGSDIDDDIPF